MLCAGQTYPGMPVKRTLQRTFRFHVERREAIMARDWLIEGKYIEYCSCDLGCPCEAMADPTYGHCTGLVGFKIDKGHCDDIKLDDLSVLATFYFPRHSPWRGGDASDRRRACQRRAEGCDLLH